MSVFAASCAGVAVAAQQPTPSEPRQQPPTSPQPATPRPEPTTPPAQAEAREAQAGTVTLSGCVYREQDVAGRTPNPAERAGVMEDYILADVKPAGAGASSPTSGAVGTSGTSGSMYKLEQIADERLSGLVGKRVEVMGRIDAEAGDTPRPPAATPGARSPEAGDPTRTPGAPGATPGDPSRTPGAPGANPPSAGVQPDRSAGPDRINLPEFEVTSIREAQGGAPCPAKPSSR
jgi:hypothetical protein